MLETWHNAASQGLHFLIVETFLLCMGQNIYPEAFPFQTPQNLNQPGFDAAHAHGAHNLKLTDRFFFIYNLAKT
ncbi:MAG: hypothetical protein WHT07_08005 [Desulfobaccales bacterium]